MNKDKRTFWNAPQSLKLNLKKVCEQQLGLCQETSLKELHQPCLPGKTAKYKKNTVLEADDGSKKCVVKVQLAKRHLIKC